MRASDFEYRHQMLPPWLLLGVAVGTYLFSPDDVVWAAVRHHANPTLLERIVFGVGTLEVLICALLETLGYAHTLPILRDRC